MTLHDDQSPVLTRGPSALALLETALQVDPLLRLRSQAAEELRRNPGSASWQDALLALDLAIAQMAAVRVAAGLDGVGLPPPQGVRRPIVIDLTDGAPCAGAPRAGVPSRPG